MKKLYVAAVAIGAAAVIASVAALILDKSLPYRIGLANYPTYLWADRLTGVPVALALLSLVSGCAVKRRIPLVLGLLSLALLFLFMSYVRSGPNPQAWCFNNLRAIDGAKDELAVRRDFTNGTAVTFTEISPFLRKGTDLPRCAEGGQYIINSIGKDARCNFHGTVTEIEAGWQKQMVTNAAPRAPL
jgi:hypothetical protein